jgi:hypothetical protein
MPVPALVTTTDHLLQILDLQQLNLRYNITEEELNEQGFVTLRHDLKTLEQMHRLAPSVVILENEKVVAYALTMLPECRPLVPELEPMFALLDRLSWNNQPLGNQQFYVMGQVCIAKAYRGQGLFEKLYQHHKKIYQSRFDLFITEISARNRRSLRAHEKTGFKIIHTHQDELDEWLVAGWDWS